MLKKVSIDSHSQIQLTEFFVNRFGYKHILINYYDEDSKTYGNELVFVNKENPYYQVIRVCDYQLNKKDFYNKSLLSILDKLTKENTISKDSIFLDIHICKDLVNEDTSEYDLICIDDGFYSGIDLEEVFPGLKDCVHPIEEKGLKTLLNKIDEKVRQERRKLPFLIRNDNFFTKVIMGICIVITLISMFLSLTYSEAASEIFLGGDYMTFTLGLKQFYRLITSAFIHGGFLHLFMNMYSLYYIGSFVERNHGHLGFLFILFSSILIGSLTSDILNVNQLTIGLSGGLYGLLLVYFLDFASSGLLNMRSFSSILLINLAINFMPNVAWQVHLGGAVGGYLCFLVLSKKGNDKIGPIILLLTVIICLFIKYCMIDKITPLYGATDMEVINMINNLGFKKYADKLYIKLLNVFSKYGG